MPKFFADQRLPIRATLREALSAQAYHSFYKPTTADIKDAVEQSIDLIIKRAKEYQDDKQQT